MATVAADRQRLDALDRANEIRSYRRVLKENVRAGRVSAWDVVREPEVESMAIFDLLLAIRMVGRVKAQKALAVARVAPGRAVGALTERQLLELRGALRA